MTTHKKYSQYMITLNSNMDFYVMSDAEKKSFKKIARSMFSSRIKKYVEFLEEGDILDIKKHYRFEIAPMNNRLHLHGVIRVTHNSKIRLDYKGIRENVNKAFGQPMHLNIKASGDPAQAWKDYIDKGKGKKTVEL